MAATSSFNLIFGPRQDPASTYAAVIPKFIECALRSERPPIYGDGKQSRDFTFIANVVEGNLKACTAEGVAGEVFNIACGGRFDLLTLVAEINSILGTNVEPELLPTRKGDVRDSQADIGKARAMLGYTAGVSFREGLERTIDWYRGGPDVAGLAHSATRFARMADRGIDGAPDRVILMMCSGVEP